MDYNISTYVREYLKLNYATYCNCVSRRELDAIIIALSKSVRNKYVDAKLILSGNADKFMSTVINKYMNEKHQKTFTDYMNLKNYINKYVAEKNNLNCSNKTLNYIAEKICCTLFVNFDYNKNIKTGYVDEEISVCYDRILRESFDRVSDYVETYVSENIIPLTDIDNTVVANEVVNLIKNSKDINIVDLLLGKYNSKIVEIAEKNRNYNKSKRLSEMPDTREYIRNVIEIFPGDDMNLVNQNIDRVDMKLKDEGLSPKEIVSRKYDLRIRKLYNSYRSASITSFIRNSVKSEEVPEKYEPSKAIINLPTTISSILIAATLVGSLGMGLYSVLRENKERNALDTIRKNDPYGYSPISSIYDQDFKPTVLYTIDSYAQYCDYGLNYGNENYNYLAFYKAYDSITSNKLHVMDNLLQEIKEGSVDSKNYDLLMDAIRGNSCYLSFIYDRLYDMGYTEIRDEYYEDLLQDYVSLKNKNPHADPVESLNQVQRKRLDKVLTLYEDYSRQYLIELGVLLAEQGETVEQLRSGR